MAIKRFDGALYSDADGQLVTPNWSGERIYLGFHHEVPGPRRCAFSGKDFDLRQRIGFFIDLELDRPVAPSVALTKGFSMTPADLQALEEKLEILETLKGAGMLQNRSLKSKKENKGTA